LFGATSGFCALVAFGFLFQDWLRGSTESATALLTYIIVFAAALVSSVAGFAFSALAGSGLVHLYASPAQAVRIMALCSVAIQFYAVIALWRSIDWHRLAPFLVGGTLTVPIGVRLLAHVSFPVFALALGLFLIGYSLYMLLRRSGRVWTGNGWIDAAVGALGGITGGLAAFPGAFVTVWCGMRGWDKSAQRAVYQPYILVMQLLTIACMHEDSPHAPVGHAGMTYLAATLFAAHLGLGVFRALNNQQFGYMVSTLLMASGVLLIARSI
jgi:uncharacterized membrane protein YfcA